MTSPSFLTGLRARWPAMGSRERALVLTAGGVVGLALVWWVGVAPALIVMRQTEGQQRRLDTQLEHMQRLAAEAQAMQSRPAIKYDDALRALESSIKQGLGSGAQLNVAGERATLTLKNVPAGALAQWLTLARVNARALPVEARLVRGASPGVATWDGALVLNLPPR